MDERLAHGYVFSFLLPDRWCTFYNGRFQGPSGKKLAIRHAKLDVWIIKFYCLWWDRYRGGGGSLIPDLLPSSVFSCVLPSLCGPARFFGGRLVLTVGGPVGGFRCRVVLRRVPRVGRVWRRRFEVRLVLSLGRRDAQHSHATNITQGLEAWPPNYCDVDEAVGES